MFLVFPYIHTYIHTYINSNSPKGLFSYKGNKKDKNTAIKMNNHNGK